MVPIFRGRPLVSSRLAILVLAALLGGAAHAQDGAALPEARFAVTPEAVTAPLEPFTATVGAIGNGAKLLSNGGFEPVILRNRFQARGNSPDRIILAPQEISGFDTWREGLFDGADVEVLRIEKGQFVSVRRDRVAQGGFRASGWLPVVQNRMLPADKTDYLYVWANFNGMRLPYYFTVRAVDAAGNVSAPAPAIRIQRTAQGKAKPRKEGLVEGKLSGSDTAQLAAPGGFSGQLTPEGGLMLHWDRVPGAAGYMIYRSDSPPEAHRGYAIVLEGPGEPIRTGDMVLLRQRLLKPDPVTMLSSRVQGVTRFVQMLRGSLISSAPGQPGQPDWEFRPHPADTPVSDPGETYLHIDMASASPQEIRLGDYAFAGTSQSYYEVLDPAHDYRFDVWVRGEPGGRAQLLSPRLGSNQKLGEFTFDGEWRQYRVDFRVPLIKDHRPFPVFLQLQGTGTIDVDNLRLYRADTPYLALLPEEDQALKASGMQALRSHALIKTGIASYDLAQLTNPGGSSRMEGGNTLAQTLQVVEKAGMRPWIQIEPHLAPEEWLGLAEYLAAPFDPARDDPAARPWAARRVAQGHPEPWADSFDRIYFEIGNETWNGIFAPWTFSGMPEAAPGLLGPKSYTAGQVYGLYQEYVLNILRQSPWWDRLEPKLMPVLGGRGGADYGSEAAALSPQSRYMTVAAYNGGWDAGEEGVRKRPEDFAAVMGFAVQAQERSAARYAEAARELSAGRPAPLQSGTYEAGPGYVLNGLNGAKVSREQTQEQEAVMKSAAAGAATLDNFLIRALAGDRLQNFFTFSHGMQWSSHAPWFDGGQAWPSWDWLALFNRVGLGEMLAVETLEVPRRDLPQRGRRKPMDQAPMVAVYATRAGDRVSVAVISRLVPEVPVGSSGHSRVRIDLPFKAATRVTRYATTADYAQNNLTGPDVQITGQDLSPAEVLPELTIPDLPPASAQIYVFEGVSGL